jgi:hypothetical protein
MLGSRGAKRYKPSAPENVDGTVVAILRAVIDRRVRNAARRKR